MSEFQNFEIKFITLLAKACSFIYPKKEIIVPSLSLTYNVSDAKKFLVDNRLNHLCAINFKNDTVQTFGESTYKDWINQSELYKKNLYHALSLIKDKLKDENWLLIKTISSYPHFTSDIDVLVLDEDLIKVVNDLNSSLKYQRISRGIKENDIVDVLLDAQNSISWTGTPDISSKFIWSNTRQNFIKDLSFKVPNENLDFLIRLGHIPFELAEFRLGELLHLFSIARKIDFDLLEYEAKLCSWPKSYKRTLNHLNQLHLDIFGISLLKSDQVRSGKKRTFPNRVSYFNLALSVVEKRAWQKIVGARYVLRDRILGA